MPLPRLGGLGSALGGLATVFGAGLEGYAKDQATRVERERVRQKDLDDAQRLKIAMDEHTANLEKRQGEIAAAKLRAAGEKNAFTQLAQLDPTHPDVRAGYLEGGTYSGPLKEARDKRELDAKNEVTRQAAFRSLVDNYGGDPIVRQFAAGGYTPEKGAMVESMVPAASTRWTKEHEYHAPIAPKGMWAHDNTTDTDVWVTPDQAAGMPERFTKPKGAAGGGSGGGSLTPTAIQGMYDDLTRLHTEMKDYEDAHPGIGTVSSILGAGAGQKHTDLKSAVASGLSNALLGVTDPDYQKYRNNNARAGNIISQINSKRGTEYQSLLDIEQSGQHPGDASATVASKQLIRANALAGRPKPPPGYVPNALQTQQATTTPPPARTFDNALTSKPATAPPAGGYSGMDDAAVWEQAVRENGMAAVLKEFGTKAQFIARNRR